jgi:hypothetical protein
LPICQYVDGKIGAQQIEQQLSILKLFYTETI